MADDLKVEEGASSEPQENVSKSIEDGATKLLTEFGGKLEALEKELRGLQGRQDKSESAFKQQLARYNQLLKQGLEPDDAVAALERGQQQESVLQQLQKQVEDLAKRLDSGQPKGAMQEVVKAFEDLGLDTKDPRVLVAMQRNYKSLGEALEAAYKLKGELSSSPNPSPAQEPAATKGGQSPSREDLIAESERLMNNPSANYERIMKIQDELRRLGGA